MVQNMLVIYGIKKILIKLGKDQVYKFYVKKRNNLYWSLKINKINSLSNKMIINNILSILY